MDDYFTNVVGKTEAERTQEKVNKVLAEIRERVEAMMPPEPLDEVYLASAHQAGRRLAIEAVLAIIDSCARCKC